MSTSISTSAPLLKLDHHLNSLEAIVSESPLKNGKELETERVFAERFSLDQQNKFAKLDLDHFLSKKYLAHLFGDSFLEDSLHEGWFIGDALMHILQILEENTISQEVYSVLQDLKACFNWQGRTLSILLNSSDKEAIRLEAQKVRDGLIEEIKDLSIGKKVLFTGGQKGHSVLYEIKKTEEDQYEFIIYNTGSGSQKHWTLFEKEGTHKIKGAYKIENISLNSFIETDVIEQLLLLKTEEVENFGDKLYEDILSNLDGVREKMPTDIHEYMVSQRSGTCVWKMLLAYLRYNMPLTHYKYLKLKARLDVFDKWHQLGYSLDFHKTNQRLLNRLVVNFERVVYNREMIPIEFSRKELLVLGLLKVQKTFNRYKFLLSDEEILRTEQWYTDFTGQSIHENNGYTIHKES